MWLLWIIQAYEYISDNYSNPKIDYIEKVKDDDYKILLKTKISRYQFDFDDNFNLTDSFQRGPRLIPGIVYLGSFIFWPINIILVAIAFYYVYKEKKNILSDLKSFLKE